MATKKATTKKKSTVKKRKATATKTKRRVTKKAAPKKKAAVKKKAVTKKTVKAKAKTRKATVKPKAKATTRKPRAKSKWPRGYKVNVVERELTVAGVKDLYELYEVTGTKMDKARYFVDEESVKAFLDKEVLNNEFVSAVKRAALTKSERKAMQVTKDLSELAPDGKPVIETGYGASLEIVETVKNTEDTDK